MKKPFSSFIFHPSSFRSGFTLIEIMLVVVIILIATAVAVPIFRGTFSSTRMKDATRSTVRIARYARSMAILKQSDCTLTFTTNRVQLNCEGEILANRTFPAEVRISRFENLTNRNSGSEKSIQYYANGMNDGFEIELADDDNRQVEITCNPITGKVTVDD